MTTPTVIQMVKIYLDTNALDGLFNPCGCACEKSDLAPCGEIGGDCQAGYYALPEELDAVFAIKPIKRESDQV